MGELGTVVNSTSESNRRKHCLEQSDSTLIYVVLAGTGNCHFNLECCTLDRQTDRHNNVTLYLPQSLILVNKSSIFIPAEGHVGRPLGYAGQDKLVSLFHRQPLVVHCHTLQCINHSQCNTRHTHTRCSQFAF